MKKVFILALVFVGVLASCSKKDENKEDNQNANKTISSLIGTWHLVEFAKNGQEAYLDDCMKRSYIRFTDTTVKFVFNINYSGSCNEVFNIEEYDVLTSEQGHFRSGNDIVNYSLSGDRLTLILTKTATAETFKMTFKKS